MAKGLIESHQGNSAVRHSVISRTNKEDYPMGEFNLRREKL